MKILSYLSAVAVASCVSSTAFAYSTVNPATNSATGFYVGAQLGYGTTQYGNKVKNSFAMYPIYSESSDGLGGRAYLGFQITPVFGVEMGYSGFSNEWYKAQNKDGSVFSNIKLETETVDLLATYGTPLCFNGFGVAVKGGVAYVMSDYHHTGNGSDAIFKPDSDSNNRFAPAAGVSILYKFSSDSNLAADLSYLHVFSPGGLTTPETDLITLGLSYRFA